MARPTKYRDLMVEKSDKYLEECIDDYEKGHLVVNLPSHEGLAAYINVAVSTIYKWAEKHKEFSEALERVKDEQKKRLIAKGLSGDYNATIAKLILSSNHDMREKVDTDITTRGESLNEGIGKSVTKFYGKKDDEE